MVDYAVTHYGSDPHRVYVTGLSAGGAMTAVMLATYPDVFTGGAIIAGIPYRCATDLTSGLSCQTGATSKSPAQWGDLVRAADSGYQGPWPRVAVWYGTSDSVVNTANACATGATAFREGFMAIKAGQYDVVLAVGVEQMGKGGLLGAGGKGDRGRKVYEPSGRYGSVVPGPAYSDRGRNCRAYTETIYIDGRPQTARGTACRNPDGSWTPLA